MDNQTIDYLKGMEQRLGTKISEEANSLRSEFKEDMNVLRDELTGKIEDVRDELTGKIEDVRDELTGKIEGVAREVVGIHDRLCRVEITLENDVANKISSLASDGFGLVYEKQQRLEKRVETIENRIGII